MDAYTKDVCLAAIAIIGTLGSAYIAARWNVTRNANNKLSVTDNTRPDNNKVVDKKSDNA